MAEKKYSTSAAGTAARSSIWRKSLVAVARSEEHTSELHHANISYAVFCLKKKNRRVAYASGDQRRRDRKLDASEQLALAQPHARRGLYHVRLHLSRGSVTAGQHRRGPK